MRVARGIAPDEPWRFGSCSSISAHPCARPGRIYPYSAKISTQDSNELTELTVVRTNPGLIGGRRSLGMVDHLQIAGV